MTVATMAVLLMGAPAAAQATVADDTAWDQAAAGVPFTVWRPAQTLGFIGAVDSGLCDSPRGTKSVGGGYSPRHSAWAAGLNFTESTSRTCVGREPPTRVYRTVRVHGVEVQVRVACPRGRKCRVVRSGRATVWWMDLSKPGGVGRKPTYIRINAFGITMKTMLRIVETFARVDLTRPTIHIGSFLSPDRLTWCTISNESYDDHAWCVKGDAAGGRQPRYSGEVHRDGTVAFCHDEPCAENWDVDAPVLRAGQTDELTVQVIESDATTH
jgi:hypothetical protein